MARPKPTILLEWPNKNTHKVEQIIETDAIYAVFYDGKPISLRSAHSLLNYPGPRYKKTSFPSKGHAKNLAKKLNKLFKTDKFQVVKFTTGTIV